jgi:hypothetical protein
VLTKAQEVGKKQMEQANLPMIVMCGLCKTQLALAAGQITMAEDAVLETKEAKSTAPLAAATVTHENSDSDGVLVEDIVENPAVVPVAEGETNDPEPEEQVDEDPGRESTRPFHQPEENRS